VQARTALHQIAKDVREISSTSSVAVSGSQGIERSGAWRDCSIMRAPVRRDTP